MNKITSLSFLAAALMFTACNKKENPQSNVKPNGLAQAGGKSQSGIIAYVEVDSITTQYEFSKEQNEKLQREQETYRNTITSKQQQFQKAVQAFQQKAQSGGFTSQQQGEAAQAALAKQQQEIEGLQEKYTNIMAKKATDYQKALRDSLNNFLKDFNKDGKYSLILAKQGDNVLYADKSLDITADVIAGLNKRYKK